MPIPNFVSSDQHEFYTPLPAVEQSARKTVSELFAFITAQGDADYIGERVSQLEHSLQCADLARKSGADDETVLGALLHDVGRFIPAAEKKEKMIWPDGTYVGIASHEVVGEEYLRHLGFSEKVCQLVGAHVMAKRYLTAVDQGYYDSLSQSSKRTLKFQGGIFDTEQVREAEKDPWLQDKLSVRRWDDLAKVPGAETQPLSSYEKIGVRSLLQSSRRFEVHGRSYELPQRPTVVICVDGFDPEYLDEGLSSGKIPAIASMCRRGLRVQAKCAMPSFTNPNNVSIITGTPPSVHGIAGNFFLDQETGVEHMVQDATLLRGSTILAELSKRGVRVAAVTAKDKLRKILAHGLENSICFSAEEAGKATISENGISDVEKWMGRTLPDKYSADLSLFVLDAGIKLLSQNKADFMYLTLSDYVQHHHAPGSRESDEFMSELDRRVQSLLDLGADVTITGDHGMSDKTLADSNDPNVLFLQDVLEDRFGKGCARVICPITDPFVKHHGALGSFVRVHLPRQGALEGNTKTSDRAELVDEILTLTRSLPQVELALGGSDAATKFELPKDREGGMVVVATKNAVIGSKREEHDLSALAGRVRLRSHGGLSEQCVPLLSSRPLSRDQEGRCKSLAGWRNFDAFAVALIGS